MLRHLARPSCQGALVFRFVATVQGPGTKLLRRRRRLRTNCQYRWRSKLSELYVIQKPNWGSVPRVIPALMARRRACRAMTTEAGEPLLGPASCSTEWAPSSWLGALAWRLDQPVDRLCRCPGLRRLVSFALSGAFRKSRVTRPTLDLVFASSGMAEDVTSQVLDHKPTNHWRETRWPLSSFSLRRLEKVSESVSPKPALFTDSCMAREPDFFRKEAVQPAAIRRFVVAHGDLSAIERKRSSILVS